MQVRPSEIPVRLFHIAQNSETDDQVFEQILSEMQDGGWSIDEKGALVGPWLVEALNQEDGGENEDEEDDEYEEEDEGQDDEGKEHGGDDESKEGDKGL